MNRVDDPDDRVIHRHEPGLERQRRLTTGHHVHEVAHPRLRRVDAVTGVSTGALIAPFAFIGTDEAYSDVVDFYDAGGVPNPLLDPLVRPLALSDGEKSALVAFLESLTGDNVAALVSDAFAAPIGNPD